MSAPSHAHRGPGDRIRGFLTWLVVASAAGFIAFSLTWLAQGGRWERVETASMGREAPVGSLLWVKPVPFDSLRVGDFITFHPPGLNSRSYSHRVDKLNADGTISTKGVIPAPDPWKLTSRDIVGQVMMNWWGVGWLAVATPLLLVGFAVVGLVRWFVPRRWKLPLAMVLGSVVLSLAFTVYKPFVNAQQVAFAPSPGGGADASYVGTGLLPVRLSAHNGPSVVMHDGEIGHVHVSQLTSKGTLEVSLRSAIPWWWWVLLVGACFVPVAYVSLAGPRSEAYAPRRSTADAPSS